MQEALGGYHLENPPLPMALHVARSMAVDLTLPGYAHRIPGLLPRLDLAISLDPRSVLAAACASLLALALLARWVSWRSRGTAASTGGVPQPVKRISAFPSCASASGPSKGNSVPSPSGAATRESSARSASSKTSCSTPGGSATTRGGRDMMAAV